MAVDEQDEDIKKWKAEDEAGSGLSDEEEETKPQKKKPKSYRGEESDGDDFLGSKKKKLAKKKEWRKQCKIQGVKNLGINKPYNRQPKKTDFKVGRHLNFILFKQWR